MSVFNIFTHPEFWRFKSSELCPSLCKRGAKSPRGSLPAWTARSCLGWV